VPCKGLNGSVYSTLNPSGRGKYEREKYHVRLTEAEKKRLLEITKKGNHPARQIVRANILLQLDERDRIATIPEQETIAKHCGCQAALVSRVGKQYERGRD
jgi:hypothetical protein